MPPCFHPDSRIGWINKTACERKRAPPIVTVYRPCESNRIALASSLGSELPGPVAVLSLPSEARPALRKGRKGREDVLAVALVCFASHVAHAVVLTVALGGVGAVDRLLAKDD